MFAFRGFVVAALTVSIIGRAAHAFSSADELVRQARAHEASADNDVAVRRYMEALTIEPSNADAWMGLGQLRMRLGDAEEAERVYTTALDHLPSLHRAFEARARARWALGRHGDAEADLETYGTLENDPAALRELASWYSTDGRTPAQLGTWRRLLSIARRLGDSLGQQEARRMVRALVVLVSGADPASSPAEPDETGRTLAAIAKRGG